jgi:shikimate kinase
MVSLSNKPLRLALVGMSGAGKSYWAKQLAAEKIPTISCDDQIEARLAHTLLEGGFRGINGVAAWMGWPDSPTYAERESQYLLEEIASLDEVLTRLEKESQSELVLDTTGSVIYTGNNQLFRLRKLTTVVYLAASSEEQQLLIQRYLKDPKPVLWRGAFQPRGGETSHDTVARCYPALLAARKQGYQALSHCTIAVAELWELSEKAKSRGQTAGAAFLERVRQRLNGA